MGIIVGKVRYRQDVNGSVTCWFKYGGRLVGEAQVYEDRNVFVLHKDRDTRRVASC